MSVLDGIVARAALNPRRILFPDADGAATIEALARLTAGHIVVPCFPDDSVADDVDGSLTRDEPPEGESVVAFHLIELATPTAAGETVLAFAAGGATVASAAAEQFRLLCGTEPRVALLSFSTHGSARHRSVETVRETLGIVRASDPGLCVGGELQGDAALVPAVAASKAPEDPVAGRANVLVFPDHESEEIGRELVRQFAGARVAGPFLAGTPRPVNPLSRGASAEAIVLTAAVTALQAARRSDDARST